MAGTNKNDNLFGWLNFASSIGGVAANVLSTIFTNRKNEQLVRAQNAFQRQESELAYQRAKPQNQVSQMMQAGMSKAGALNAINGGATYQPAPITSATAQAPQVDLTSAFDGLLQIGENAKQRKLQEDLLQKNIAAAVAAQKAQFEENERQRKHDLEMQSREHTNTNRNADNRLDWEKKQFEVLSPYQIRQIEAQIDKINADVSLTKTQEEDLQYKYAEYVSNRSMRDALTLLQELESTYKYHVTENDFNDFKRSYMYYDEDTDSYQYTNHTKELTKVESFATHFWDVAAKIFPANKIGKIVSIALGK